MRNLTKEEIFAMYFWHEEYAKESISAINFHKNLSATGKRICKEAVDKIIKAKHRS